MIGISVDDMIHVTAIGLVLLLGGALYLLPVLLRGWQPPPVCRRDS